MRMQMCSIYDAKAEVWTTPIFFQATGQAVRSFSDSIQNPESEFAKHPDDYTLFHLGEFDVRTGQLELLKAPVSLGCGVNFKLEA